MSIFLAIAKFKKSLITFDKICIAFRLSKTSRQFLCKNNLCKLIIYQSLFEFCKILKSFSQVQNYCYTNVIL